MTEDTGAARKGRPRSPETIARDDAIMQLLRSGPRTRNALARSLGISNSLTSIAINRLKAVEKIKRCVGDDGEPLWTAQTEEPCP